jgi:predicted porin
MSAIRSATRPARPRRSASTLSLVAAAGVVLSAGCASTALKRPLVGADRPGFTFVTATAPTGVVQSEFGYTDTRSSSLTYQTLGEGLLRVGVAPNTELRVFSNSYALRSDGGLRDNGMEDAKVGFKQRLWAGKGTTGFSGASLAVLPATSIPSGSAGFGAKAWQPELLVAAGLPITPAFSLASNIGDQYIKIGDERSHKLLATLAGWYTLSPKVSTFVEYGGTQLSDSRASRLQYFDAGFAFVPIAAIQLDVRAGHGVNGLPNDNFFGVGLVRRW